MTLQELLEKMWIDYRDLNPQARKISDLLTARGERVLNDHIALRTLKHPRLGLGQLGKVFKKFGYVLSPQEYVFAEKKLYARHYEHPDATQPKIFISELELEKVSPFVREQMIKIAEFIPDTVLQNPLLPMIGRPWPMSHEMFLKLAAESEYAAWFATHGFRPNHFTVNVNALKGFPQLTDLNHYLEQQGFPLNQSGGAIKGSAEVHLEQSSTMANETEVSFSDGKFQVPGCYYEFAKRYPMSNGQLYQGFVATSADKIFESTNRRP